MIIKALEIRDRNTFIPMFAVLMVPSEGTDQTKENQFEVERFLLRRAGYGFVNPCVMLCRMDANGLERNASYDPYGWGGDARTFPVAHQFIIDHWGELKSGDVIDVEFILGETKEPKQSERIS